MARTVAVSGASGFIGRRLIERLGRDGVHVRALMRNRPLEADIPEDQLHPVKGSLSDQDSLVELVEGADAVVHLAGLIKARRRQDFFDINAGGVAHLAKALTGQVEPAKLVLVSSLAAREPGLSSYGASKRCGEAVLLDLGKAFPWTVLRPPAVYGPGDRETLAFFKSIQRGIGAMLGDEQARFSLLHVDDLTDAIARVIDRGCADGGVLELDDGAPGGHSWSSMIDAGERAIGAKARRFHVPKIILTSLGYINEAFRIWPGHVPMLTSEKVRELTHPDWVADSRLIRSETSWRPAIGVDSGFRATVDWYRLHSWL